MKKIILFTLCAFFVFSTINAKVYYVASGASDANAGDSWATAVGDPQVAMEKAQKGDEIWMKGGSYTLTSHYMPGATSGGEAGIWAAEGVSIYGSFAGTETSKDQRVLTNPQTEPWAFQNQTFVSGGLKNDGKTPLRLLDRADKTVIFSTRAYIDGLTFKDYDAVGSRLIYLKEQHTIANCAFINCKDNTSVLYFEDGGKVENSLFQGCKNGLYVRSVGGPAPNTEVRETIEVLNCVFKENVTLPLSVYNTGAPVDETPSTIVTNCQFLSNNLTHTDLASGKFSSAGLDVNHSQKGRKADISNCLFENNSYKDNGAATVRITGGGHVNFYNNIIRNNTMDRATAIDGQSAVFMVYNKPGDGNIFNNLIVNNTVNNTGNTRLIYGVDVLFFNNTIANNTGNMYFPNASILFNNIFSQNLSEGADAPVGLDAGKYAMYTYNANTVDVTLQASENDFVEGNVLLSQGAGFVSPTTFTGVGDIDAVRQADYSLNATSQAKAVGNLSILGAEGLNYPSAWFDKYFTTDLAGNTRVVDGIIDAGAYQSAKSNSFKTMSGDKFCIVYANEHQVSANSLFAGKIAVYDIRGVLVSQNDIKSGLNTFNVETSGLYIVKVISAGKTASFKVSVR